MNFSHLDWWCHTNSQRPPDETPISDMWSSLLSCCSGLSKRLPKYIGHCCWPWLSPRGGGKSLLLKTPCTSENEPKGSWAGTDLNTSPWGLCTRRHHISFQRGEQLTVSIIHYAYHAHQGPTLHDNLQGAAVAHKPWWLTGLDWT